MCSQMLTVGIEIIESDYNFLPSFIKEKKFLHKENPAALKRRGVSMRRGVGD